MANQFLFFRLGTFLFVVSTLALIPLGQTLYSQNNLLENLITGEETVKDTTYLRELNEKARELLNADDHELVRPLIDEAYNLAQVLNDLEGEAFAVSNLGGFYIGRGLPDSVLTVIEPQFEKYRDTRKAIRIGNNIGNAHNMKGNYQQGLERYLEMRELAAERGDLQMKIGITQNIGNNYSSLGDIPAALDHYFRSLEMAEETSDTLIIAVVLDNIATINTHEGNYELAENYLMQALEMNEQINNRGNQITNHMSLGGLYMEMGEYERAREHYDQVLEIAEAIGNNLSRMQAIYNLGRLYTDLEEYDQALELFKESLELSRRYSIMIGAYYNQYGKGNVYKALGEYDQAVELYEAALRVAESAGANDLIGSSLEQLYETYETAGDTQSAYSYLKRYSALKDSLARTERDEALARQEALLGLRTERENRQVLEETMQAQYTNNIIVTTLLGMLIIILIAVIVLYRKKQQANKLLQKRTEELSEVNLVKDKLLSVLAHDLRAPLSNMQGVVYMIRENILEKDDIDVALNQIDFQLQQGINTLTNYLEWAQSHREGIEADIQEIFVARMVENAIEEINKSAERKGVYVDNQVDETVKALADVHMMRVVLRNLLSNAVKYVEAGDRISVRTRQVDSGMELSIEDTGRGIAPENLGKIFRPFNDATRGTMGELGTGLGLSICREFVEKQGGRISVESEVGKGTVFTVTLRQTTEKEVTNSSV
jgi:two-component system, sensor histidine kinase and response regulator